MWIDERGPGVVLRVGEGLFHRLESQLVAFQVDGVAGAPGSEGQHSDQLWSVLVRGLCTEERSVPPAGHVPTPRVSRPGQRVVRIRADVVTGRRFPERPGTRGDDA